MCYTPKIKYSPPNIWAGYATESEFGENLAAQTSNGVWKIYWLCGRFLAGSCEVRFQWQPSTVFSQVWTLTGLRSGGGQPGNSPPPKISAGCGPAYATDRHWQAVVTSKMNNSSLDCLGVTHFLLFATPVREVAVKRLFSMSVNKCKTAQMAESWLAHFREGFSSEMSRLSYFTIQIQSLFLKLSPSPITVEKSFKCKVQV